MFWTNVVKVPRIERAAIDGTEKTTLFSTSIGEPGGLAVDVHAEKIYWSDLELKRIEFSDFDGGNRKVLVDKGILLPNSLAVFDNYLYWTDKEQALIERINKRNGHDRRRIKSRVSQLNDILAVNEISEERIFDNQCSRMNGDCSHICVMEPDRTHRCSCPVDLKLMSDERSCAEPPTCAPDQFTCLSGNIGCIPLVWQCDGYSECEDESDELNCPTCSPKQFRCGNGQCISQLEQCDGIAQCQDQSDEENCAPCSATQFECAKDHICIDRNFMCDSKFDCADQSDEMRCGYNNAPVSMPDPPTAQYTVGIVVGLIAIVFIFIFVVFACRKKSGQHMPLDDGRDIIMVTKPLNPNGSGSSKTTTPPHTSSSSRGNKTGTTTCLTMTSVPPGGVGSSVLLYDRNHVTGASSSSSTTVTRYPKETLNPPPSPVTDRSQCGGGGAVGDPGGSTGNLCGSGDLYYSSNSPTSTVRSSQYHRPYHRPRGARCHHHHHHHHHHNIPPPPTTPCSTDVCEDSEPSYPSKRYYTSFAELDYYESDPFYPPPPTPRSHYLSDEMSCPPSPSTERSFFNPYPPPPSPVGTSDC